MVPPPKEKGKKKEGVTGSQQMLTKHQLLLT
jgi:hypothetical protein